MNVAGIGGTWGGGKQKLEKPQAETGKSFQESIAEVSGMTTQELMEELGKAKEELYKKAQKGELEESFQIGGQAFTLKEWDKLMDSFDSAQDKLKAMLEERMEQQKKAAMQAELRNEDEEG